MLKERTEEKNRKIYLNTALTNIITANSRKIEKEKNCLDAYFAENLSKLSNQFENISIISSQMLERLKSRLEKYPQANYVKKTKNTGMVKLLEVKTNIDEVC